MKQEFFLLLPPSPPPKKEFSIVGVPKTSLPMPRPWCPCNAQVLVPQTIEDCVYIIQQNCITFVVAIELPRLCGVCAEPLQHIHSLPMVFQSHSKSALFQVCCLGNVIYYTCANASVFTKWNSNGFYKFFLPDLQLQIHVT